jgi:integrase
MTTKPKRKVSLAGPAKPATLGAILPRLERHPALAATRRRDLISAVKRVAILLGDEPGAIDLNLAGISARLAAISPVAVGITAKRFHNIRSDFLAAVKASGFMPGRKAGGKPFLSPAWVDLFARLSGRRAHIGLSRLARFASARGLAPNEVNDDVIAELIVAVREQSLCPRPTVLHRKIVQIWNEAARDPSLGLRPLTVPPYRELRRIDWAGLSDAIRQEVEAHLSWCTVCDPFAPDARLRALAPRSVRLRRDQIHAAITALVDSGIEPSAIQSLADLVSPENFKRILRTRLDGVNGAENTFNRGLAYALLQIAYEWVKADAQVFAELKRLFGKMPAPIPGLTPKNKDRLRQFDDPAVLRRLYSLPDRLWTEAKHAKPHGLTLAKAQAAIAIAILCYMPLRPQNLAALEFDTHLFVRDGVRATSTLELPAEEVKTRTELAFDIPPFVAKMLIEYRDHFAPKILRHRPKRLFVNADGAPKNQASVASLIINYLRRRAGILLTPHQFRHLSAKVVLDNNPGEYETVRQFLGHKSIKTTVGAYAGLDSRRAARRHQYLIEQSLAADMLTRRPKRRQS